MCVCAQANIYRFPGLQPSHLRPLLQVHLLLNFECTRIQVGVDLRNRAGYFLGEAGSLVLLQQVIHQPPFPSYLRGGPCPSDWQTEQWAGGRQGDLTENLWGQEGTFPSPPPSQPCHLPELCWSVSSAMCSQPQHRGQKQRQGWAETRGVAKRLLVSYHSMSPCVN